MKKFITFRPRAFSNQTSANGSAYLTPTWDNMGISRLQQAVETWHCSACLPLFPLPASQIYALCSEGHPHDVGKGPLNAKILAALLLLLCRRATSTRQHGGESGQGDAKGRPNPPISSQQAYLQKKKKTHSNHRPSPFTGYGLTVNGGIKYLVARNSSVAGLLQVSVCGYAPSIRP